MKIIDDFLSDHEWQRVKKSMTSANFSWNIASIVYPDERECDELDNIQFVHLFFDVNDIKGIQENPILKFFTNKIKPFSVMRIKANVHSRTHKIIEHGLHMDFEHPEMETAIYYVNTNNGYTKFEDGTKVESVANRMVLFPSVTKHGGTTCTDDRYRMVINFNWFPNISDQFSLEQKQKGVYGSSAPILK